MQSSLDRHFRDRAKREWNKKTRWEKIFSIGKSYPVYLFHTTIGYALGIENSVEYCECLTRF